MLLAIYLAVGALAATCTASSNCENNQCDTVAGTEICMSCQTGNVPINGACVAKEGAKTNCVDAGGTQATDQTCKTCLLETFMYKNGCYETTNALGKTMCTKAADGKCTAAATGYFVPTGAVNTAQSVVKCDDVNKVTVGSNTYKGVAGCQECVDPDAAPGARADKVATCTRCVDPKYLKDNTCVADANACGSGYAAREDPNNGNRCIKCDDAASGGIADCAQCTAIASPTRSGTPLVTCSRCSTKKVQPDKKGCVDTCPANSSNNNGVCECAEGYVPDAAGTGCTKDTTPQCKTPGCKACDNPAKDNEVCTECNNGSYLTPTSQCVDQCSKLGNYYGADDNKCKECTVANCAECNADGSCKTCRNGFYLDTKECKACDSSCKSCSGASVNDCTACPSGKALKYDATGNKGTCGEGCVVNTTAESGNCKTCGLTVEGTAYCSACSVDTEYPQNGVCASKTTRATATCNDASISGGVCKVCANSYFRMNGGCYETGKYPGKSVCTQVASSGGTCQTAAPGYNVNGGTLVTCPEGCFACTSSTACGTCADGYVLVGTACTKYDASCLTCETDANTCKACASGYYKTASGGTCTSCESNSGDIAGVKGCASCAAPSGSGPVLCYLVGMAAGLISSRTCGHLCMATRVTRIASPLLGVSHGGRAPPEAVSRTPPPLHPKPCRPPAEHTVHLICCPHLSGCRLLRCRLIT